LRSADLASNSSKPSANSTAGSGSIRNSANLRDLQTAGETLWIGTIPPLVVQYILDEEKRLVFIVVPLNPLPNSGV
jgi:hypothetical protein